MLLKYFRKLYERGTSYETPRRLLVRDMVGHSYRNNFFEMWEGSGSLVGVTLKPKTMKIWASSLPHAPTYYKFFRQNENNSQQIARKIQRGIGS